jgi:RNA polymerase sporulation-specific sigma factor
MTEEEINKYSNLIHSLTHYFDGYKNKEDLYQAGIIGLLEAYKKYDSSFNTKFSTYAYPYIFGEMSKLVREDKTIKISRNTIRLKNSIEKAKNILSQKLYREPTIYELSTYLDIPINNIEEALMITGNTTSIDEPISSEGKEITYHDLISDNQIDLNTLIALKQELELLTPFEKELITRRYLDNQSQCEVASILGITQVKVSREEMKIKKKIKSNLVN